MEVHEKDRILDNFVNLVQNSDIEIVGQLLYEKGHIPPTFLHGILFGTKDQGHNRRRFLLRLFQFNVFQPFVECFRDTNQHNIVELLTCNKKHAKVFQPAINEASNFSNNTNRNTNNNIDQQSPSIYNQPLKVEVVPATKFLDNSIITYKTRSRKKGVVLIINNYEFQDDHDGDNYRKGADVDQKNLEELFKQMGIKVYSHTNKTVEEMQEIVTNFALDENNEGYDMCFVIIMSHGDELLNDTVVNGADNAILHFSWIVDQFSNENCYKTHRDTIRGSWYIELICKIFMEHAHDKPIEDLLKIIDLELSRRVSKKYNSVQTSTFQNIGFKDCYIHPGIYEENGRICIYSDN